MEPAGHVNVGLIVQSPGCACSSRCINRNKVHCENGRYDYKHKNTACFCPSGNFVGNYQTRKYKNPSDELVNRVIPVNLK